MVSKKREREVWLEFLFERGDAAISYRVRVRRMKVNYTMNELERANKRGRERYRVVAAFRAFPKSSNNLICYN